MATHVKVIAVLLLIGGGCLALLAFALPTLLGLIAAFVHSSGDPDAQVATTVLGLTGLGLSIFFGMLSIPFLATGWGMLKLKPWSRIGGIILAALSLIHFPFGTAFGIYALIILFKKETEALFAAKTA